MMNFKLFEIEYIVVRLKNINENGKLNIIFLYYYNNYKIYIQKTFINIIY
jgi:hypothetical protein